MYLRAPWYTLALEKALRKETAHRKGSLSLNFPFPLLHLINQLHLNNITELLGRMTVNLLLLCSSSVNPWGGKQLLFDSEYLTPPSHAIFAAHLCKFYNWFFTKYRNTSGDLTHTHSEKGMSLTNIQCTSVDYCFASFAYHNLKEVHWNSC